MAVVNHTYSEEQLNAMKRMLQIKASKGKPADYEIRLDGIPFVHRTKEVNQFDSYKKYMTSATQDVNVLLYEGTSRNNTQHIYHIQKEAKQLWNPFMDLSPEQAKDFYLAHERRQWENDELRREIERLNKKLEKKETEQEEDAANIEDLEKKLRQRDLNWGRVFSYAFEGAVRRGIPFIANFKGAEELKKFLDDNQMVSESETESYFFRKKTKKKEENKSEASQPVMQEKESDQSMASILDKEFCKEKKNAVASILVSLAKRPEDIAKAQEFLNRRNSQNQWKEQIKMFFRKVSGTCNSIIAWIKAKYRLAIFLAKNIKYLKGML